MKAAIRLKYGSPGVLTIKEVEIPAHKDNEVLIRVYATTVNRTDCAVLSGKPFIMRFFTGLFKPKLSSTGTDFAGRVEAIGKKVTSFKVGDRVWGFYDNGIGSHAEYMTVADDKPISSIPGDITYEEAAAAAEGAHYAYNFIKKVDLTAGQKVLVNGATGAIGSAAVQFLKYFGVWVTAVCNTENIELIKSLGADKIIDYTRDDFTKDDGKYDFIFDAVGKSTFGQCKHLLRPRGIYMSSELGPKSQNILFALVTPLLGGKKVIFPVPTDIKGSMHFIKNLIEQDKFKPVIDREYPLERIGEAFEYVASGQKTGNVIITMKNIDTT
jgi:NADPH:quinone reductase-like Zn-dependent oxidoreductase